MNLHEMEARLIALEKKVSWLDDINQVKRLQRAYSYYVLRMMRNEIVDCFADRPDVALYWLEGAYLGKEGVKRYFGIGTDRPLPEPEFFHEVMPIAGVVDVDPDGQRAKGRWYTFGPHSLPLKGGGFRRGFVGGIYEIEYIKENGVWKFLTVNWQIPYSVTIPDDSWRSPEKIGNSIVHPDGPLPYPPADIPLNEDDPRFMSGFILPFHYPHPVTGKPASDAANNQRVIDLKKKSRK